MSEVVEFEIAGDAQFFAPVSADLIDGLIGQYQQARQRIDQLAALAGGDLGNVIHYFIEGNCGDDRLHRSLYVDRLFKPEGAIAALNAAYWSKAMGLTDVYDAMPQKRRDEWNEQIRKRETPAFEEDTVRATIMDLLNARSKFFAERVDGIFRALSHEHVTNCPQGFGKRMIVANLFSFYAGGHASSNTSRMGVINDLRCVIARFMGREEPKHYATNSIIENGRRLRPGEWITLDGGALRIRCYLKGTAHLEVHPDMAWRLNQVLASMHPAAIPAEFRTPPKRKPREWRMMSKLLPFAVIALLERLKPARERYEKGYQTYYRDIQFGWVFDHGDHDKAARAEAERVLEAIGGVRVLREGTKGYWYWQFDYLIDEVLADIVASGCIPDQKSHQFYPTPESVAAQAIELAQIGEDHFCLEPSAGQGGLADLMPKDRTDCVEISGLHCGILRAKGYRVVEHDFLTWRPICQYARIVMNPPFSEGRAKAHVEHALSMLKPGGRLVAVLPASFRGKGLFGEQPEDWTAPITGAFADTSVSVAILAIGTSPVS